MTDTNQPVVQVEKLGKVFLTDEVETHALMDIDLEIHRGEYVCIGGPSGCGKSTLLSILGLLDTPTTGQYRLNGQPVEDLTPGERARIRNQEIGFVFQAFNLIGEMTVEDNVALPLLFRTGFDRSQRRSLARDALQRVAMDHRATHLPAQLSGGQQQRVAVARAIVGAPRLLLADEPTGNLDSHNGEAVMALLDELNAGGATICMVTHDPRYAEFAQRSVDLFDGRLVDKETMTMLRREEEARIRALIEQGRANPHMATGRAEHRS